ncbi:hypothetical protein Tcan_11613 [Toxocara canis]|uniref:Uncharacterized protein n=1 Tax=Toxocara canis TaxID=6265 RepID=A0A0B2VMS2_TOXCA|nr:hypothetical protein Tcan_11613 [Toxocara canis]
MLARIFRFTNVYHCIFRVISTTQAYDILVIGFRVQNNTSAGEMCEESSTREKDGESRKQRSERTTGSPAVERWSWNCFPCWRKQRPAIDPSAGALPPHWLDPNNKNFRTRWTEDKKRKSIRCSVANGDILEDKTVFSSTASADDDSVPYSETGTTTNTTSQQN